MENVDRRVDIPVMLRFAMRTLPVPYIEIPDGTVLAPAFGTGLR